MSQQSNGTGNGELPKEGLKAPQGESQATEEFLAVLPAGSQLPEGFATEAAKLGLDPSGNKRAPYPAYPLGSGISSDPSSFSLDWRLSAPPDSEAYRDALKDPKDSLDGRSRETLKIAINMGLPPYTE